MTGDFNVPFSMQDRSSWQKISNSIEDLHNIINNVDLMHYELMKQSQKLTIH